MTLQFILLSELLMALQSGQHLSGRHEEVISLDAAPNILQAQALPKATRTHLLQTLEAELRGKRGISAMDTTHLKEAAALSQVRLVHLRTAAAPAIVVSAGTPQAGCGAANCPFWIFEQHGTHLHKLWDSRGPDGIGGGTYLTLLRGTGGAYKDFVLHVHDSAFTEYQYREHYKSGTYKEAGCRFAEVADPSTDKVISPPKLSPCR